MSDRFSATAFAEGVQQVADAAGLPPPDAISQVARILPLNLPLDEMASRVADMLGRADGSEGLFLYQNEIVTVDPLTGQVEMMKTGQFRSWLPDERNVFPAARWEKDTGEPVKGSISEDQAKVILQSKILRRKLPVITAVHHVRMPILDEERDERGMQRLRLLPRGYDPISGVYTAGDLEFAEDMNFDDAVNYFWKLFHTFAWRSELRDFAIHLAAIVTMFSRGLYEGKAPMIVYNANIQESGKTTLAWYVTWLVTGTRRTKPLLQDEDGKLESTLNSMALQGALYTTFDNVDWGNTPIKTELLDQWISNVEWDFRKLNTNQMESPKLRGLTIMTGNNLKLSPDLQRRSLIVDLWNPLAGADRVLPADAVLIDGDFFANLDHRKKGLAAVWAIIRHWDENGRPRKQGKLLGTFESWSAVVPSIVWFAGGEAASRAWDCMAPGTNEDIGDNDSRQYRQLAEMAIAEFGRTSAGVMAEAFEITVQQFAGVARRNAVATFALWPDVDVEAVMATQEVRGGWRWNKAEDSPFDEDGDGKKVVHLTAEVDEKTAKERSASEWLNPKTRSSFGKALDARINDRWFTGPDGFSYHVKKRPKISPARYAISVVKRK